MGSTFEELLYRGYLVGGFTPLFGPIACVLGSSALFGLAHLYQGAIGVARTAVIGLAFGIGFALTQSLWWLVIAHVAINLSGLLLARQLSEGSAQSA